MGGKAHSVELGPTTICFCKQMSFGHGFLRAWEAAGDEKMSMGGFFGKSNRGKAASAATRTRRP